MSPRLPKPGSLMSVGLVWSRQMTTGDAYNRACVMAERANCPEANGPDYDFGSSVENDPNGTSQPGAFG